MFKLEQLMSQLGGEKYIDDCAAEMLVQCGNKNEEQQEENKFRYQNEPLYENMI